MLYLGLIVLMVPTLFQDELQNDFFRVLIVVHIFIMLLTLAMLTFSLVHLYRNNKIRGNDKVL